MGAPAKRKATYQDVLDAPEHLVAEILDGELITSPRPAAPHARATSVAGVDIGGPFDRDPKGPGGWWILDEPELHLGPDILVPDLAGWRKERMPRIPNRAYFELAPDWVCEVVSPSTVRHDRIQKRRIYARESVQHLWLVDPIAQVIEAFVLDREHWSLLGTFGGTERARIPPFDAVELDLAGWWLESEPQTS